MIVKRVPHDVMSTAYKDRVVLQCTACYWEQVSEGPRNRNYGPESFPEEIRDAISEHAALPLIELQFTDFTDRLTPGDTP